MNSWIGKQIGKCRIEQLLGVGGMGAVYKVKHLLLDKVVALKLLHPNLLEGDSGKELVERFIREAQAAAKLEHPNIIPIYDIGVETNIYYIVMQYISGGTLLDVLGKLPLEKTLWITKEIAKGLQSAHAKGIIHRDIKPANILISDAGEVKITDFGLAKVVDDDSPLSQKGKGKVFGTPQYLSPEQAMAKDDLDGRADLYSLGVTIFHLFTGNLPYTGNSASMIMEQHVYAPIPSIRLQIPNIPDEIEYLMRRLLAKNRNDRFTSGNDVVKYIESIESDGVLQRLQANSTSRLSSTRRLATFRRVIPKHGGGEEMACKTTGNRLAKTELQELHEHPDTKRRQMNHYAQRLGEEKPAPPAMSGNAKVRIQIGESGVECVPAAHKTESAAPSASSHANKSAAVPPMPTHAEAGQHAAQDNKMKFRFPHGPAGESERTDEKIAREAAPSQAHDKKYRLQLGPSGVECVPAEAAGKTANDKESKESAGAVKLTGGKIANGVREKERK